ncbi:MAG TPA: hypothetical protein VFT91_08240, partial [Dehalococcoidia bacterium]|nr:hypothetical protein [Dehalococcoidia bacterium]
MALARLLPGLLVAVAFAAALLPLGQGASGPAGVRAEPDPVYRAVIMAGPGCFGSDGDHLARALLGKTFGQSTNWTQPNTVKSTIYTVDGLKKSIGANLPAGDNDVSLLYLCDHGSAQADGQPVDEGQTAPKDSDAKKTRYKCGGECDERIGLFSEKVVDDQLDGLISGVKGDKILIFDACLSGGMKDGASDLRPNTQKAVVLTSADTNYVQTTLNPWTPGGDHGHSKFTGSLIAGLSDNG